MDYKAFFEMYGDTVLQNDTGFFGNHFTVEQMYIAFEARILAKLEEQRIAMCADDWEPTFGEGES